MISIVRETKKPLTWVDLLISINITNKKINNKKVIATKLYLKETLSSLREIKINKTNVYKEKIRKIITVTIQHGRIENPNLKIKMISSLISFVIES